MMQMGRYVMVAVVGGLVLAGGYSTTYAHEAKQPERLQPSPSPVAAKTCGGDKNPCPLEKWMNEHTKVAVEKKDLKQLAKILDQIADLADAYPLPKSWNTGEQGWAKISKDAAAAARAGDFKAARASCKGCHKPYRKKFQKEFGSKPLPKGWGK